MQKQQTQQQALSRSMPCVKCMKIFLIVANIIILMLGIAALAVGVWSLNGDYGADNIEVIMESDLYTAGSVLLIVGGAVTIITAVLGIVGVYLQQQIILGIYIGIMIAFGLFFVTGAIVAFFFMDEVNDNLARKMTETLQNKYGIDTANNADNKDVTTVWNDIQRKLKCCGVRGGLTSQESWYLWQSSEWYKVEGKALNPIYSIFVPSSCCNSDSYLHEDCQEQNTGNSQPPKENIALVDTENPALFHTGCLDALEDKINDHIIGIIVIAIFLFVLIILCAVFSIIVCLEGNALGKVV